MHTTLLAALLVRPSVYWSLITRNMSISLVDTNLLFLHPGWCNVEETSAASGTLDASGFCVKDILDIPGLWDIPDILELRD